MPLGSGYTRGPTDAMLDAAYDAWQQEVAQGLSSLLIAADNEMVTALNTRARADRVADGTSSPTGVDLVDGSTAGVGDTVITRLNARTIRDRTGQQVSNGDQWTVTDASRWGDLLLTRADRDVGAASDRPLRAAGRRLGRVIVPAAYVA
jgi:hypothetical protein